MADTKAKAKKAKPKESPTEDGPKGEPMVNVQLSTDEDQHGKESVHLEA